MKYLKSIVSRFTARRQPDGGNSWGGQRESILLVVPAGMKVVR